MKKNLFINVNMGESLKKYCLAFAVFVMSLVTVNSINNIGGTYAASTSCPSGYSLSSNDDSKCCPTINGSQASYSSTYGCMQNYDNECPSGFQITSVDGSATEYICTAEAIEPVINITITLNANGGAVNYGGETFESLKSLSVGIGSNFTLPSSSDVAYLGHIFKGWLVSSDYSTLNGKIYNGGVTFSIPDTVSYLRFTAQWEEKENTAYSATFDSNGGSWNDGNTSTTRSISYTNTLSFTDSKLQVSKNGFELCGWNSKKQNTTLTSNLDYMNDGDVLTAKWCNTTTPDPEPDDEPTQEPETPDPEPETPDTPSGTKYTVGFVIDDGVKLYVNNKVTSYTNFSLEEIDLSDFIAEKDGYAFNGWASTDFGYSCTNNPALDDVIPLTEYVLFYPCFSPGKYKIQFSLEQDEFLYYEGNETGKHTFPLNELDFSKFIAKKEGYTFTGWSSLATMNTCTEPITDEFITLEKDMLVMPCFVESVKHNVTFNLNGGSLYKDGSKNTTTTYSLSEIDYASYKAEKTGYIFKGWRTSGETCTNASLNKKLTLSSNLSLFACYDVDSDIEENPNTGSFLLYVAYLIGILSLGYTIYYAYKGINAKN